jgi:uncharacterized small protein (DUF1192 family)
MRYKLIRLVCALAVAMTCTATGIGQEKKPEKETVETTGFKAKIFEMKHREPNEILQTISPLGSGAKGAVITVNSQLKMLTIRDFPENIAAMEEAIKRLDVPRAARGDSTIELTMHVLLAHTTDSPTRLPGEIPNDLKDVVKQLQQTFTFKHYVLAATIVQRAKAFGRVNNAALAGSSQARWNEPEKQADGTIMNRAGSADYHFEITSISVLPGSTGGTTIHLDNFKFEFGRNTRIQTHLEVRDGEKLVVGTASYGEQALILVLSAKAPK